MDTVRTALAKMAVLAETAAMRYLLLAEQQTGRQSEIEGRSTLMRVALAAMRSHAHCLAALASLQIKCVK